MEKFKLEINVKPEDIPNLDDAHKRDCADAVNKAMGEVFKYTLIFAAATAVFYVLYVFFGFLWLLRMKTLLPQISALVPITAAAVFIFEFAAGTMNKWALTLEILLLAFLAAAAVTVPASLVVVPFVLYGIIRHVQLIALIPFYKVLTSLPGYPDFTPLPIGDVVRNNVTQDKIGNSETADENEKKSKGNGNVPEAEMGNEGNISVEIKETTVLPKETGSEEMIVPKGNGSKKKKGNKKRGKKQGGK